MTTSRISLSILLALVLLGLSPTTVVASPRGKALHQQALAAAESGLYPKAKKLWEEAFRLDQEPKYLFNLGLIAERSDKPLEALAFYERFLKLAPDKPANRPLRAKAKARVKAISGRLATVEIVANQPGVKVFVDRRSVGEGPLRTSLRLTGGDHLLVATLPGHQSQTRTLKLSPGETRRLEISLPKLHRAATMRYPMPRWLPWTILGTGVALAIGGVIPMVMQIKAYDDYNDSIDPILLPKGDLVLKRRADRLYAAGIALLAVGGAVAAGGLVALLLNRPKLAEKKPSREAGSFQAAVGPGSVTLRILF